MTDERGSERVGRTIRDKYTLDRVLGVGGMAVVYVATHRNRKRFAIKMLHPELSQRKDVRDRFLREGYVANTVDHPGSVSVVDDDVAEDGSAFLVMELLDGAEVEALWERNGHVLPLNVTLACADQLLDVLVSAHQRGVVHRDLKPANLFVTKAGQLKVLDFGIARLREGENQAQTQTGAMMGTPAYLPPEQAAGRTKEIDGQTDLWAVGATVFTLLSGQFVHSADNGAQMVIMSATQQARSLRAVMPGAPPWVVAWVDRALALGKRERWADAASMQAELRRQAATMFASKSTATVLAEHLGARPSAPDPSQSPFAATVLPDEPAGPGRASAPSGRTTAQPVSATFGDSKTQAKRRPWVPIVLATVGAATLISGAILFAAHGARTEAAVGAASTGMSIPAAPPVVATVLPPAASALPSASATPSAVPLVPTAPHPAPKTSGLVSPKAPVAQANPNCDPPFTVDGQGKKHFKPDCF